MSEMHAVENADGERADLALSEFGNGMDVPLTVSLPSRPASLKTWDDQHPPQNFRGLALISQP